MTSFHKTLAKGQKKSEALRNAKLEYLANANDVTAHPFFWAPFVVIGNDAPLTKTGNQYLLVAVIMVGLLSILLVRRSKAKNQGV